MRRTGARAMAGTEFSLPSSRLVFGRGVFDAFLSRFTNKKPAAFAIKEIIGAGVYCFVRVQLRLFDKWVRISLRS